MNIIKAPHALPKKVFKSFRIPSVFLAGSIEMGKAVDWQTYLSNELSEENVLILSPRRDDWDSSWEQKIENPQFKEQVEWELNALDYADIIVMYFDPLTKSPISLLELGLYADTGKLIVCCPEGFWRKGNVDIVCQKYNIPIVTNLDKLIEIVKDEL